MPLTAIPMRVTAMIPIITPRPVRKERVRFARSASPAILALSANSIQARIAQKWLSIFELCGLWRQNTPYLPEHFAAPREKGFVPILFIIGSAQLDQKSHWSLRRAGVAGTLQP